MDNLPLSKTSLHGATRDTYLGSITYWEETTVFTSNGQQEVGSIGDFRIWANTWGWTYWQKVWMTIFPITQGICIEARFREEISSSDWKTCDQYRWIIPEDLVTFKTREHFNKWQDLRCPSLIMNIKRC